MNNSEPIAFEKKEDELQIHMVITDIGHFMTDTLKTDGYDYKYHKSKIKDLYFDGEKPEETFVQHWFKIDNYPEAIQKKVGDRRVNKYWVLKDKDMESKALPLKIAPIDSEDIPKSLYNLSYDTVPGELVDIPYQINVITEVHNFKLPPTIDYKVQRETRFDSEIVNIDRTNIEHQLLDKLIIPEVLLHEYPCRLSSKDMFSIIREHIKNNIDNTYARVSSDYKFCFSVFKKGIVTSPGKINHRPLSGENFEIENSIEKTAEFEVFEMTHENENYKGYSPIREMTANNEHDLKEKLDNYLEELMNHINAPIL